MSQSVRLNSGHDMPVLGVGTWLHKKDFDSQMTDAVEYAIKAGYRQVDCAYVYLNEPEVGHALKKTIGKIVDRKEMFITSKLWNHSHAADDVQRACQQTLDELGLEYLDLYLMHYTASYQKVKVGTPGFQDAGKHAHYDVYSVPQGADGNVAFADIDFMETWKAMENLVKIGMVKSIGMSNFNHEQMERVIKEGSIKPAVLQVERNPRFTQPKLLQWCRENDILMVGYSPFGSPDLPWPDARGKTDLPHILADPVISKIAESHKKSTAQIVLRWNIQGGLGICPKSVFKNELDSNLEVFDFSLTDAEMVTIDGLNTNQRKLIAVITLPDGTKTPRDGKDKYYPFNIEY